MMTSSEEDRVRVLPEDVLQHIISFMDMKQVVQMSILSKRWRYLWLSVPNLNFNHTMWSKTAFNEKAGFMDFVDLVLRHRGNSNYNVAKFFISCSSYYDVNRIYHWVASVAKRHPQEVHIEIKPQEFHVFPPCLFTPKLERFTFEASRQRKFSPQLPNTMCSSANLKTLILVSIVLPNGDSNGELLLICPVLEILILHDCYHGYVDILKIYLPQLKNLVLENYDWIRNYFCKIKICTPRLESFKWKGYMYKDYCLENLSSLVSANIGLIPRCKEQVQSLVEILKVLPHADLILTLRNLWFKTLCDFGDMLAWLPNPFQNIRHLTLIARSSFQRIASLLKAFPCIETIVLDIDEVSMNADLDMPMAFECFFHQLKRIEIRNLQRSENQLKFLEVVMKNAIVLEKINITIPKAFSMKKEEMAEFSKKLQSLSGASSVAISLLQQSDSSSTRDGSQTCYLSHTSNGT